MSFSFLNVHYNVAGPKANQVCIRTQQVTSHRPNSFSNPITNHRTFHILLHYDQSTKTLVRLFLIRSKTIILKVLKSMPPLFRMLYVHWNACTQLVHTSPYVVVLGCVLYTALYGGEEGGILLRERRLVLRADRPRPSFFRGSSSQLSNSFTSTKQCHNFDNVDIYGSDHRFLLPVTFNLLPKRGTQIMTQNVVIPSVVCYWHTTTSSLEEYKLVFSCLTFLVRRSMENPFETTSS